MYIILSKNVNTVEFTSISNEFKSMEQMSEEIVLLNTCQPQSNAHFLLIITLRNDRGGNSTIESDDLKKT